MSLFKTEEFWSTKSGQGEEYITNNLCVANFFANSNSFDQIITGSLSGYLRLFSPSFKISQNKQPVSEEDTNNPFSFENPSSSLDINIEYYLKQPILQLEAGKFCYNNKLSLAVLNPNRLVILEIDEETMSFKILEEFNLKRVAYNFCFGNFGRISERDFICVQSTDTTLSFYINGHLSFDCFLSDYLLPGPIQFLLEDDSILIINSNRYLQAYKFKNLAVLNNKSNHLTSLQSVKCATADWEYNLGEDGLELKICETIEQGSLILILTRFSVFIFSYRNRTALKKRFESRCRLLFNYGLANQNEPRFLLTNSMNELMVFQNTTLKWKAHMINPKVVDLTIGKFDNLNGFIVTLNEIGNLAVIYLGTDPSTSTLIIPSNREIFNENNEDELTKLQQKIKTLTSANSGIPIAIKSSELSKSALKLQVDYSSATSRLIDKSSSEYSINIKLKSSTDIRNVLVRISTQQPITSKQKSFYYYSLSPNKDVICSLLLVSNASMVACSLRVRIYVTYELNDNNIKVSQISFNLPLNLVVLSCAPVKQAKFKITLDTSEEVVNLSQMFNEFPNKFDEKFSGVVLAFQYFNDGPIVTILASAAAKRYRIQSDHFEAIWLIMKELSNRLIQHFGSNFQIKFTEPLPLDSYFLVLDFHFSIRTGLNQFYQLLEERSKQFRAIEKLFLTKTKDKSLTPLQNLDTLLENSINQLLQLSNLIVEQEQHLAITSNAVRSATSVIGYLLQIASPIQQSQQEILQHAFSVDFRDFPEIGLEELYEEIFVFLLRNMNNQSIKELKTLSDTKFELPNNIDKLKRHIQLLCEQIGKGLQLSVSKNEKSLPNTNFEFNDDKSMENVKTFVTAPHKSNKSKKLKKNKNIIVE